MLKLMREKFKHLKIILWMVVFVFVLLIFVDWGTGRRGGRRGLEGVAAQVGKTTITERAYLREMRSSEERFRQMYGQQWETVRQQLDLGTMVIQNLIERELLGQQADEMGLGVTDQELLDKITSFPAFHRPDGSFVGPDLYAAHPSHVVPALSRGVRGRAALRPQDREAAEGAHRPGS